MRQYTIERVSGVTSLTSCHEVGEDWVDYYPESFWPGFTMYQRMCAAPANYKQPARLETEYWIAITDKTSYDALPDILRMLHTPPFHKSMDERGNGIDPVPLPVEKYQDDFGGYTYRQIVIYNKRS